MLKMAAWSPISHCPPTGRILDEPLVREGEVGPPRVGDQGLEETTGREELEPLGRALRLNGGPGRGLGRSRPRRSRGRGCPSRLNDVDPRDPRDGREGSFDLLPVGRHQSLDLDGHHAVLDRDHAAGDGELALEDGRRVAGGEGILRRAGRGRQRGHEGNQGARDPETSRHLPPPCGEVNGHATPPPRRRREAWTPETWHPSSHGRGLPAAKGSGGWKADRPPISPTRRRASWWPDGHELDVGLERQPGLVEHGAGGVVHVHQRLDRDGAVGLGHAFGHPGRPAGVGVSDVDLAAGDAVFRPSGTSPWSGR